MDQGVALNIKNIAYLVCGAQIKLGSALIHTAADTYEWR